MHTERRYQLIFFLAFAVLLETRGQPVHSKNGIRLKIQFCSRRSPNPALSFLPPCEHITDARSISPKVQSQWNSHALSNFGTDVGISADCLRRCVSVSARARRSITDRAPVTPTPLLARARHGDHCALPPHTHTLEEEEGGSLFVCYTSLSSSFLPLI